MISTGQTFSAYKCTLQNKSLFLDPHIVGDSPQSSKDVFETWSDLWSRREYKHDACRMVDSRYLSLGSVYDFCIIPQTLLGMAKEIVTCPESQDMSHTACIHWSGAAAHVQKATMEV